jgi:hypothetical protein
MRISLDIDDDLLVLARELAARHRTTAGKVISALARQAFPKKWMIADLPVKNGLRQMPRTDRIITAEFIEELLEPEYCPETGLWII